MPRWSRAARRILPIKASTSRARAPPVLTMKLAWTGETSAPLLWVPLSPSSSINLPAAIPAGFLKTQPALGARGCDALRLRRDASVAYFQSLSKRPLPEGSPSPEHSLEYYKSLSFPEAPGI